jgi:hypothetical protein
MTMPNDMNRRTDDMSDIHEALGRTRAAIDAEIARSGASRRITAVVLAEAGAGEPLGVRWFAVAATLVIAAGLGGLFQATRHHADGVDIVVLDPLTFGAVAVDQ